MEYFKKDFLEIHWDEDAKCVIMHWKKFAAGEDFRTGLNKGLQLIIEKNSSRWLADMRNMQVLALEDQDWANQDWFPRAIKGGIRKMALVQPKSALAKMGVRNVMNKVMDVNLETNNFDNVSDAKAWLKQV